MYKRQGHVIVNHKERTVSFQAQVNMKEGILEYVCCMPNGKLHAVSYTHLDVYKRQMLVDDGFQTQERLQLVSFQPRQDRFPRGWQPLMLSLIHISLSGNIWRKRISWMNRQNK